ncbi:MAG: peptide deformylase [Actinomycetales bacterium]|nr:peptide deformylase [Actinomycetales bacterium]
MSVLQLRLLGDPVLTTPAREVTAFDRSLHTLIEDMRETMLDAPGIGLAAPQVGVSLRVLVYQTADDEQGHLCNPVLELADEQEEAEEGCLSLPGLTVMVPRAVQLTARGVDCTGAPQTLTATGLLARCLQHETDHLDGILTIDRTTREERRRAMREIREAPWFASPVTAAPSRHWA